jgi:protein O-mannosyl-transferase
MASIRTLQRFFSTHPLLLQIGLICILPCIVFFNTFHNEFHLDDIYRILKNPEIQSVQPVWRHFFDPRTISSLDRITQYRPLLPLTFSINYFLAGGHSLAAYHITNMLFHIVASILVFFLCRELLNHKKKRHGDRYDPASRIAFFVAGVFAVHPVSGIPINYIMVRDIILLEIFMIGSLLAYVRMRRSGDSIWGWALSLLLFLCALLSKTNAVALPALVFLFEITLGPGSVKKKDTYKRVVPFILLTLLFFSFTRFVLKFSDLAQAVSLQDYTHFQYALTQAKIHVFHYLRNFFWPFYIRLMPSVERADGLFDVAVLFSIIVIGGSIYLAFSRWNKNPLLSFSILAYWVALGPTSSIVPLYHEAAYYRPYPAIPFLLLAIAPPLLRRLRPNTCIPVLVPVLVYFGVSSIYLNKTYRTEETLWTHTVRHGGDATAHMNLAMSIKDRSDPRVRKHLEETLRLNPGYVLANINFGLYLMDHGGREKGLRLVERAVELSPSWAQCHYWLSKAYARLGRKRDAFEAAVRAAKLDSRCFDCQYNAALLAQQEKAYAESLKYLSVIERRTPRFKQTLFLKGFALQMSGRVGEAVSAYRKFLVSESNHYQAHFNLAHAYMTLGNCEDAVSHFKKTLTLKPDYTEANLYINRCSEKSDTQN